uniref:Uncharacterized protein n=1 Tax=Hyaloperonospora arabidopsidis (strain Emoy2) TaxID=559515 RepID=M4BY83_HYAAE
MDNENNAVGSDRVHMERPGSRYARTVSRECSTATPLVQEKGVPVLNPVRKRASRPESGAAQTGPRVSESASSDGGCGSRAGESCIGGGEAGRMVVAGLGDSSSEGDEEPNPKRREVHRGGRDTMVPDHPKAGAAVTRPRVSKSASSDGGCGPRARESCVGEGETGEMVPAGLGDRSAEGEEELTPKRRRVHQGQDTMVADQTESCIAQTGPRASESASSDGGCGLEAGESCVGKRLFVRMVAAGVGDSSSEEEEYPTPTSIICELKHREP